MVAQLPAEVVDEGAEHAPIQRWHSRSRVVFRFGFVFVGIGMAGVWLAHALLRSFGVPQDAVAEFAKWTSLHPLTDRVGAQLFDTTVDYTPTASGDTATQWISLFTLTIVAIVATAVWSALDRDRPNYVRLHGWFRLLLRASLISALLLYGMIKLLPSQMTFSLERLVEPFGDMSPMAVLWAQTAASEPYEIALGAAEITAALLLVLPRTAGLGAVLAFIATLQVALLNLTYDVPVKIFSLQLLTYATILAAPDIVRIVRALLGQAVPTRAPSRLLDSPRGNRLLLIAQVTFGVWLLFTAATEGYDGYRTHGNGREQSPLYGIWNVTEYTVAGRQLPPLVDYADHPNPTRSLTATDRFQRVIFDIPIGITAQRMDDSLLSFPAAVDTDAHTITISKDLEHRWKIATFTYTEPEADRLVLDGQLAGSPVHMQLDRVDLDRYPVVSRGFHWVQAAPYFR
ncbi:DoxX family protein [Nocardia jejuensis]|uniref:DoxX family protein n=1 Tax=Nocardia jejuensis TaxID=328049 RepID=UPI000A931B22|nr:DoxX family protein [Nocardia jejuensis]